MRDPRFYRLKAKSHKIKVDPRFKTLFKDEEKQSAKGKKNQIDKYGRQKEQDSEIKDLRRFYNLSDEEDGSDKQIEGGDSFNSEAKELNTSSGSEESDDFEQQNTIDFLMEHVVSQNPLVNTQVQLGDATKRLSLINLDWDQIKAVDIFVLLNGFKPVTGAIKSVKIFPSEFGKERLDYENLHGPMIAGKKDSSEKIKEEPLDYTKRNIVEENKRLQAEEKGFDEIELRKYQLERLKYYFAIVECDSVETAATLYKQCDGMEFEKSANFIDLRYVPDGQVFDEEDNLHDYCESMPVTGVYKSKANLVTTALQNSKVKLTWDGDDICRTLALKPIPTKRRGKVDWNEEDLEAYLASASSGDEVEVEKYRKLLVEEDDDETDAFGTKKKRNGSGVEVTFTSPFGDTENEKEFSFQVPVDKKKKVDNEGEDKPNKKRDKKKSKKREKGEEDVENTHILENILLPERMANKSVEVDVNDPRFKSIYESHEFAIDPTHKSFKKTPGMHAILQEKHKRRK